MSNLAVALLILAVVVIVIYYRNKNKNIIIPMPTALGPITIKAGQTYEISPDVKITYTTDGNVCLNYIYKGTIFTHCELIYHVDNNLSNHFVTINNSLAFNSYTGSPTDSFMQSSAHGFGIGFLADKMSDWVAKSNTDPNVKSTVYNDIVNSVRAKINTFEQPSFVVEEVVRR